MNLSDVVLSLMTGTYSVTRAIRGIDPATGVVRVEGQDALTVVGCLQPLTGRELKRLPEGMRAEDRRVMFTTTKLNTADELDDTDPDTLLIDGGIWEVVNVEPWSDQGGFWRCVLQRTGVRG